ncbi:predicted protein [Sclerotinia sclerotiorum 1980 UF-70]|uniref:Uncharacterized protein n=1 Tax=Sclerotinia sclerotiorum (strain ATCC 18683 / 1980 / Ss-1) TaxID=665079 RepID=A7E5F4_SCLS1|nr:predicted protein [Sclerotinia sclerotiorum 1980 UF-70]EDN91126.1 predicted protein [Sclerotinia sclerotiorum 1980 UF-70]
MSTGSHHENKDLHYSEKASTAEQQKHAGRTCELICPSNLGNLPE